MRGVSHRMMRDPAFRPHLLACWEQALPEARVVELDDVGHWPHEEAPERVIDEIRDFLGEPAPGTGVDRLERPLGRKS